MSRYQAAFYNFLLSLSAFAILVYFVLFKWYPGAFYSIDGGWEGLRIIIGVELVLGPCLTMIVFKTGKPGLKMDLSLIAIFQLGCLLAGAYIMYSERPVFFIYYEQYFYSVNQGTFEDYNLLPIDPAQFEEDSPVPIFIKLPENAIEEADVRKVLYQDGVPLWLYTPFFEPLAPHLREIIKEGFDYGELAKRDQGAAIPRWLESHGGQLEDYAFFPIHSRYREAFLAVNKDSLEIVGILEIAPPTTSIASTDPS